MAEESRYRLHPLTAEHTTHLFSCGDPELDEYLHDEALTDMKLGLARTFVEIDAELPATPVVVGFFTLRAHALAIDERYFEDFDGLDEEVGGTRIASIETPLVDLMYLARDERHKGIGIGDILMIDALRKVGQAADCIGFIGLHLRST